LENRNEVFLGGQRVFLDSLLLDSGAGFAVSAHQVGRFNCFATCLLVGQPVASVAAAILAAVGGRPVERGASLITSASPVAGGVVVRIAGEGTEPVGRELGRHLQGVVPLLGDDPWARKW
jgi:urease accessory protein UreH